MPDAVHEFPGYPKGWFAVALSDEITAGSVHSLRYFGQDLVAYRTSDGRPTVLEAYCPHLGAHLGVGGTIVDDCVRCPFHAWRFDADGACVEVPYARAKPKQATLRAFPTVDRNGLVFVHFDPTGAPPSYEVPVISAIGDPAWTTFRHGRLRMRTHSREIVENVVDRQHFGPVHHNVLLEFENEFAGHLAIQRSKGHGMSEHVHVGYAVEATYYGPAFQITEMRSTFETLIYNAHTMIDEHYVDLRFGVMIRPASNDSRFSNAYVSHYIEAMMSGFRQDAEIWEHKRWRDRPILADGDGPIGKLRAWYAQFY